MLSADQKKRLEEEIVRMEESGEYSSDEIDAFIIEVNKKHGGSTASVPAKDEKSYEPNWGDAAAPSTGKAIREFDSEKDKAWKVDKSQPDWVDSPTGGGKQFNHKKYENPERVKLTEGVLGGLFNDALSFLPRAAGTVAGKLGKDDVSKGESASVKDYMADPNTHLFKGRKEQNFKDYAEGKGPGRYIDLLQGIGVDAAGDPLSYAPWAWGAKGAQIAKEINLANKAAKAAGGVAKGTARYLSGIRGKVGMSDDVLEYSAKRGIGNIEKSDDLATVYADIDKISEAQKAKLSQAIEDGRITLKDIEGKSAAQIEEMTKELSLKKDAKVKEFTGRATDAENELITDVPHALSRDTKENVYRRYNEITDPIEGKVTVDFTQSEYNPLKVIDGHHKYGTPEFEKFKTGLKKEIEDRLFKGNNEYVLAGTAKAPGEQILKEKKLFQDLAAGTFGEVTDAQKTVYKDVAHAYREALEEAAVKQGNPEYIETMRKKANVTQTMKDATKSFLPKNISSDLEVSEKVRKAIGKFEKSPETLEKLKRLDKMLVEHGLDLGLSQKADDVIRYRNGMDQLKKLSGSGKSMDEALAALDEMDPGFAKAYRDDLQAISQEEARRKAISKLKPNDPRDLDEIRKLDPDLAKNLEESMKSAEIAADGKKSITEFPSTYKRNLAAEKMETFDKAFPEANLGGRYKDARAKNLLKGDETGKIPWFDINLTGKSAANAFLGSVVGGAPGAIAGGIVSSPRMAVKMFQGANLLDRITTGPVLDKLIAALETGNSAAVIRWLSENGYSEE